MDLSMAKWLSELEMDDLALNYQLPMMNPIDQSVDDDISFEQFSTIHDSYSIHQSSGIERKLPHEVSQTTSIFKPSVQLVIKNNNSTLISTSPKPSSSPSPGNISFGNGNYNFLVTGDRQHQIGTVKTQSDEMMMPLGRKDFSSNISSINSFGEQYNALEYGDPFDKGRCRTPLQLQDHVLAERRRREKLSQQFIALSAVVPGLKKLSKEYLIGGAIKYIKELEERIKVLEEEERKKRKAREESVVSDKRPRTNICYHYVDGESSSDEDSDEDSCDQQSTLATEIELSISGGHVIIRVHCKNHKGIMVGFLSEMGNIHLSIICCSCMPFGDGMLLINDVAKIDEKESCITAEDLATHIRQAILKLL